MPPPIRRKKLEAESERSSVPAATEDEYSVIYSKGESVWAYWKDRWFQSRIVGTSSCRHPHDKSRSVPGYKVHYSNWGSKFRRLLTVGMAAGLLKFRLKARPRKKFDMDKVSQADAQKWFRFDKSHLEQLRTALRIPDILITPERDRASGVEAICIVLRRYVYPNRLFESARLLKRSAPSFSRIFNHTTMLIYREHGHLLRGITHPWMDGNTLEVFASKISARGAPLDTCVGFIPLSVVSFELGP